MSTEIPAAPTIVPAAAVKGAVPLASRLMPSPGELVEDALSRLTEPPVDWMWTAAPLMLALVAGGGGGMLSVPALMAVRPVPPVVLTANFERSKVPVPPARLNPPP